MTPEERERQERIDRLIEFLANNQAQLSAHHAEFSAHHAELSAHQAEFSAQQEQLSARQAQLSRDIENLRQIAATHTTQIGQLADTVLSLAHIVEDQARRTDERFRITGERLDALIAVVERYFSNGRKG